MNVDSRERLPITDPQYLYPKSLNPYFNKIKNLSGEALTGNDTESHAGKWLDFVTLRKGDFALHKRPTSIHVEIGCNAGHVLVPWAVQNPDTLFIGLDWKFKAAYNAYERAKKSKAYNTLFLRGHAERLHFMFGPGEIDTLSLFFPDPWERQSQWKHRYIRESLLREISKLLKPGALFWIKTDHSGYFEWMLKEIEKTGSIFEIESLSRHLHSGHPNPKSLVPPEVTLFEKMFIAQSLPIYSIKLKKI